MPHCTPIISHFSLGKSLSQNFKLSANMTVSIHVSPVKHRIIDDPCFFFFSLSFFLFTFYKNFNCLSSLLESIVVYVEKYVNEWLQIKRLLWENTRVPWHEPEPKALLFFNTFCSMVFHVSIPVNVLLDDRRITEFLELEWTITGHLV